MPIKIKETNKAVAVTEFGGYSYAEKGHTYSDKVFGYLVYKDKTRLNKAIERLYKKQIYKAKEKGINACIFTQLTDVEEEINGLVTYDREVVKIDIEMLREINKQLTIGNN